MNTKKLSSILKANGTFSIVSASAILIFTSNLVAWGIPEMASIITGIAVFLFGLSVLAFSFLKQLKALVPVIVTMLDLLWVIFSLAIILFSVIAFSAKIFMTGIAFVVALFAFFQLREMKDTVDQEDSGSPYIVMKAERIVSAPLDKTWELISDINAYSDYAGGIQFSRSIENPTLKDQVGIQRSCGDYSGNVWKETVTRWEEKGDRHRGYDMLVHTEAEDYGLPFSYVKGHWNVESINNGESKICLEFHVSMKVSRLLRIFMQYLAFESGLRQTEELLNNWEHALIDKKEKTPKYEHTESST